MVKAKQVDDPLAVAKKSIALLEQIANKDEKKETKP